MFNFINQQLKLFCVKRAAYYAKKGDFKSIMKSLDWLQRSIKFINDDKELGFLQNGLNQIIKENAE